MAYVKGKEPFTPDLSKFKGQAEVRAETGAYLASNQHFQDALNATADAIDAAKKADSKVRFCAWYMASKGMTTSAAPGEVMRLFAELKIRLARGTWKNLTHLMADITSRYGVAKEQMG